MNGRAPSAQNTMFDKTISLLYTTARVHLIDEVIERWLTQTTSTIDMVIVTDEPCARTTASSAVRFITNTGRRDCVTGWNLAAQMARGDIFVQVSDDLYPPPHWDHTIQEHIHALTEATGRQDVVLNLLDERQSHSAVFHPVMTRAAYETLKFLYPPDFESMYCDNWFCLFHQKYSGYAVSSFVFWHHRHRVTHDVAIDDVMLRHESTERYQKGLATLNKYMVEHQLADPSTPV